MNRKLKPTSSIFEILKKYDIRPNKIMGQNFLIDENVLNKIIESADIESDDTILEIGPGLGILTLGLARRAKKIIAIEKDKTLCEALRKILDIGNVKNVEIINTDILEYKNQETNYKIVANIPYYLTSPLVRKFLESDNKPSEIILMIQKEVAQRICATPPRMSLLAISVQFYAQPEIIAYIPKDAFYPVPKVDSAIIKITPYPNVGHRMPYINTKKFFELVRAGFASKRKMLKNNLPDINLEEIGLNPKTRAENLSIDDWSKLYENFEK